jgi:acyl-CoA reductase-like NAD-dependent aldehyde dehydrogenase/nicotinamidase-related amidase
MNCALLLIDVQGDYLAAAGLQPAAGAFIARTAALLEGCRKLHVPVVHIWTTIHRENDRRLPHWRRASRWECVAGTTGHEPPAVLQPLDDEAIVHKIGFNSFADSALDAELKRLNCDTVILAGLHLHACVRTAAVESLERGYRVRIAEDAVASNDPVHAASTRRWLAERCVEFVSAAAILADLAGGGAGGLVHRSPRVTAEVLFDLPIAAASEVAAAVEAAQGSSRDWRRMSPGQRLELLEDVAKRLDAAAPDLALQMALEIGKPLAHGLEEARRAAGSARDVLRRVAKFDPERREAAGVVRYQPLGVVAIITPWNNPVAIPVGKIVPALVYGNTVVWKSAPAASRIAQAVLKLIHAAGVPPDAVRLLSGDHTTAQSLAAQEGVDAVTFTGSLLGGYAIQEICARRIVPLQAELSGNNAAIVWDDADLHHAAEQIAWGAFAFAGQRCTANRRVIVHAPHFEDFLRELKVAGERLVWGDPLEKTTDLGPVIHLAKRDELASMVATAGADASVHRIESLHAARAQEGWVKTGAYAQSVIICCDRPEHVLVQEETMSPLLIVQRAEDFEHALELCNGVRHGLAAALFTSSRELQQRFLEEAKAGILKFNSSTAGVDASLPFGGWKASGIGPPEHGDGDRLFYTRMQALY